MPGAFAVNSVSLLGVLVAIALMRGREFYSLPPAEPGERGIVAGFRYVLGSPRLLVMFGLAFVLGSLGRNYQVTMAAMAQGPLDAGAGGYGALCDTIGPRAALMLAGAASLADA